MGSAIMDSDYKCSLGEDALKKAKKELNEDPNTRLIEVKNLRKRIEKIAGLQARTDAPFLLGFLRARKFDQERSLQMIKNFYEVRTKDPEMFLDLKPSRVKHFIDAGVIDVLEDRDKDGCRVVVLRPGKWDPDRYPITDMPRAMYVVLSLLAQEEETQVNGIHFVEQMSDVTWRHATHMSPALAKKFMFILQDVLPLRLKRIDMCNEPTFFDVVFTIVKQFMKKKLIDRIHMNGVELKKLHSSISPDCLPTDLGGKLPPYSNQKWKEAFSFGDAAFEEDMKFGYVSMAVGKDKDKENADAGMAGLGGTFKKLDI